MTRYDNVLGILVKPESVRDIDHVRLLDSGVTLMLPAMTSLVLATDAEQLRQDAVRLARIVMNLSIDMYKQHGVSDSEVERLCESDEEYQFAKQASEKYK